MRSGEPPAQAKQGSPGYPGRGDHCARSVPHPCCAGDVRASMWPRGARRGRVQGAARAGSRGRAGAGRATGQRPKASACLRAFSRRSAMLEFLLLLLAAAATTAAADADSASDAMGSPKGGGGNIR